MVEVLALPTGDTRNSNIDFGCILVQVSTRCVLGLNNVIFFSNTITDAKYATVKTQKCFVKFNKIKILYVHFYEVVCSHGNELYSSGYFNFDPN